MRYRTYFPLVAILLAGLTACQQGGQARSSESDPERLAEVNTQLGIQYMQGGDYETALEKLTRALKADSSHVDAYNALGLLHANLGQVEEAERHFKRALKLDAGNSATLNNYGQFLCQLERYKEGQAMFQRAIANPLYRSPELAHSNAGLCALAEGNLEVAETHFRAALEIDPKLPPTLYQMAEISYQQGNYLPARAYLQRYAEVGRHSARSLWLGVQVERELGDRDAAASYALKLEKNFPDSNETRLLQDSGSP